MCGIVGYVGDKESYPIIIKGLQRLEYRGYDKRWNSFLSDGGEITILKQKGKVSDLKDYSNDKNRKGTIRSIGHTRWATHGVPNQKNAHPHSSGDGKLAIIHNGIIENYDSIKRMFLIKVILLNRIQIQKC